jgi:hypothetical protein
VRIFGGINVHAELARYPDRHRPPIRYGPQMSWRTGAKLFSEMWPLIQENIPNREHRIDFTTRLLRTFIRDDMDSHDVVDIHPEIAEAARLAEHALERFGRLVEQLATRPETRKLR